MPTAYIKDRIYLPIKVVDIDDLREQYVTRQYQEERCTKCPYKQDRHSDVCDDCPAYLGEFQLYNEKESKGKDYVGISVGNVDKVENVIKKKYRKKIKYKDKRCDTKFKYKIKFIGNLYDYQIPAVEDMVKSGYGILLAPPRSGKTISMTAVACKLKKKTLILASQYDYLQQFYETMCGSATQKPLTNIPDLESEYRTKICGICEKIEDFENYDICLATYQMFLNEKRGKQRLREIKSLFGTVMVDEVDMVAAEGFLKVVNAFNAKHRFGCTGTFERKDSREFLLNHVLGEVKHKVEIESLSPRVKFIETGTVIKQDYKILPYAYRALASNKKRHKLILDWIEYDVRNGHSIVIPVATVKQCTDLVKDINAIFGKKIACAFTQATAKTKERRKEIILKARKGKYKVIVGIRKMVQRGINVPAWSCIYEIVPISNVPNQTQEVSRVLTPMEGKKSPLIRHFLDDFGLTRGCLRTSLYRVYVPLKFKISQEDWAIGKKYTAMGDMRNVKTMKPDGVSEKKKRSTKIGNL